MGRRAYDAFSADGFAAIWRGVDGGDERERVDLRWDNEAWTATVTLVDERVEVVVRLSPLWRVRQILLFRDLDEPDLWLGTDGGGRWGEINGAHRPELDGAEDVIVAGSAFGHAAPIRRLADVLDIGDAADVRMLELDVETLGLTPTTVTYARVGGHTWRIAGSDRELQVDVDEHGVPLHLDDRHRSERATGLDA